MDEKIVEAVARVLEPQAWAALGVGDTLAYKNRRTSSLRKASRAIKAHERAKAAQQGEMLTIREVETKGRREL